MGTRRTLFRIRSMMILIGIMLAVFLCFSAINVYAEEAPETITVYLTVSDDGDFVTGCDGTVLAAAPLEVDYFDLEEYGLERYTYAKAESNKTPTLLHAYIRATEKFYLGRKMVPEDFETAAMMTTYGAGSLYLKRFWGHDENLMYHFNHEYAYQEGSTSIGATCDQILVSDGDVIDVAMFTSWGISMTGAFAYFPEDHLFADTGETVTLTGLSVGGLMGGSEIQKHVMENELLRVSRDGGKTWVKGVAKTDAAGTAQLRFPEPGTYYVSAGPVFSRYEKTARVSYRCVAPPICIVEVTGTPVSYEPYTVTFQTGGGSAVTAQSVRWCETAEKPADPVRDGYEFTGWYSDAELKDAYDFDLAVGSDLTLYAGWNETAEHAEKRRQQVLAAKIKAAKITAAKATRPKVTVKALKKHKAKVSWKKVTLSYAVDGRKYTAGVTGYKVYRAAKKSGKYKLIGTVKAGNLKFTDKKLKKGKKYYYKVRPYTKIDGKTYVGKWSKVKGIKAK